MWNLPQARSLVETVGFVLSSSLAEDRPASRTLSHQHGGLRGLGAVATVFEVSLGSQDRFVLRGPLASPLGERLSVARSEMSEIEICFFSAL